MSKFNHRFVLARWCSFRALFSFRSLILALALLSICSFLSGNALFHYELQLSKNKVLNPVINVFLDNSSWFKSKFNLRAWYRGKLILLFCYFVIEVCCCVFGLFDKLQKGADRDGYNSGAQRFICYSVAIFLRFFLFFENL